MNHTNELSSYEELPYPPYSFPATHIARLATIGRIFSLPTADPRQARVLEMGCGSGINLLAMAQLYPGAEFVGIDLSSRHMELADEARAATGLGNARFLQANIADLGVDLGEFDYIVAHGVYSWVPQEIREAILRLCRERLQPGGVAYISYNCQPGWRIRGLLRDMMRMHTSGLGDIRAKVDQSKALIEFLLESCNGETPHGLFLRQELEPLRKADDGYIAHELLEEENEAFYFSEFLEAAKAHRLAYLGDADPATMPMDNLPPRAAEALKSLALDFPATEQALDFVRNRAFRNTLLCHASVALQRDIDPAILRDLEITALAIPKSPSWNTGSTLFTEPNGMGIPVADRTAAGILSRLAASGRHSRPCLEVIEEALGGLDPAQAEKDRSESRAHIERGLIKNYFRRTIDLTVGPWGVATGGENDKPCALPLARWQASKGFRISSQSLEMHQPDPFVKKLIPLCDGTRDRAAIVEAITEAAMNGELRLQEHGHQIAERERARLLLETIYDGSVEKLRHIGILMPPVKRDGVSG